MPFFQVDRLRALAEAWRHRRSAYRSGRREIIGFDKPQFGKPKRQTKKKPSAVFGAASPFKAKSWLRH